MKKMSTHRSEEQRKVSAYKEKGLHPSRVIRTASAVGGLFSVDLQQLQVERELRVCWNAWHFPLAVCQFCGDDDATFAANRHARNTDVPALDDIATSKGEGERLALLVG